MGHVVLLTGATGAVGRPLLAELRRRHDVDRVIAVEHVESVAPSDRVIVVRGDVTAPALGLDDSDAARVAADVTRILHAAADTRFVRHGESSSVRTVNVAGIENMLDFAGRCRRLDGILALSTTHVAGRRGGEILEGELEHDAGFVNGYEASKYEAEIALRRRMPDLPISVCRISTVVGDSATGEIARHGAIHHAVRLLYAGLAPMIPGREDSPADLIAADYAARAVAALATAAFERGRTWHLCAGSDTILAGELLDLTLDTFLNHRPSWRRRTIERPALVDLKTFELFCESAEQAGTPTLRAAAAVMAAFAPQLAFPKRFDNRLCRAALEAHGVTAPPARQTWTNVVKRLIAADA